MRREQEREVEVHLLEEILAILADMSAQVGRLVALLAQPYQSTTAVLTTKEHDMATTATLTFTDASGNPAAPPTGDGSGITVTFASDNPAVTLGTAVAGTDAATATITGTEAFNLSATVANTSGAALVDDDGTTPFVQPASIAVAAVTPPVPQAVTAVLSAE
jgi:uncharacterized protein with PIN domain